MKRESADPEAPPPRKVKFAPKAPPKKTPKRATPKVEPQESKDVVVDKELLMKLRTSKSNAGLGRRSEAKSEKNVMPVEIAFGQVDSLTARSFPIPRSSSETSASTSKAEKEYVEPWDYTHTNYPVTLPLRRPYSGNPEVLNEEEFGESSANRALDGTQLTPAEELGLLDRSNRPQLLFFQLPASLPLPKRPYAEVDTEGTSTKEEKRPIVGCKLEELPGGFMGKILVYKSGKVKMKLGDALFDVSAGSNCVFAQDVAAINTKEKHCCMPGQLGKRAIVTPDIDSMLDSIENMD